MTNFIEVYPYSFTAEFCEEIIARFEADDRKEPSKTQRGVNEDVRSGTMLSTALLEEWSDVRKKMAAQFEKNLAQYVDKYRSLSSMSHSERSYLTPPLIEKIEKGQGFNWHIDAGPAGTHKRILSSILYLRNIEEGGATEFPYQQAAVRPQQGMMVIFPPFWTHLHRGATVEGDAVKYNITNFLVLKDEEPAEA